MTTTEQPAWRPISREQRRTWYGYLAHDNAAHVRDRVERMLTGRPYTFVAVNAALWRTPPEVRTSQWLTKVHLDPGHVWCADSYGVWGVSSDYRTEEQARKAADKGAEDVIYVHIDGDGTGKKDRIEIRQYNLMSPRELLHWVVMPEHPEWGVDGG